MPTFEDYSYLSNLVYSSDNPTPDSSSFWELDRVSDPNDNGYFGALYRNSFTNEWVMVNRGTESTQGNDLFNDLMMVFGKIPQQFDDAQTFYTSIKDRLVGEEGPFP